MKKHLFTIAVVVMAAAAAAVTMLIMLLDDGETAPVELPPAAVETDSGAAASGGEDSAQGVIEITPQNVQAVIASLERETDYFVQMSTKLTAENGTRETLISMWVRGGMTRTVITEADRVKNILTKGREFWIWYADAPNAVFSGQAETDSAALAEALNGIPDYTTVLALPTDEIIQAGYEPLGDTPCIRVLASGGDGAEDEYNISVADGLLAGYTRYENGAEVFALRCEYLQLSPDDGGVFSLPS